MKTVFFLFKCLKERIEVKPRTFQERIEDWDSNFFTVRSKDIERDENKKDDWFTDKQVSS